MLENDGTVVGRRENTAEDNNYAYKRVILPDRWTHLMLVDNGVRRTESGRRGHFVCASRQGRGNGLALWRCNIYVQWVYTYSLSSKLLMVFFDLRMTSAVSRVKELSPPDSSRYHTFAERPCQATLIRRKCHLDSILHRILGQQIHHHRRHHHHQLLHGLPCRRTEELTNTVTITAIRATITTTTHHKRLLKDLPVLRMDRNKFIRSCTPRRRFRPSHLDKPHHPPQLCHTAANLAI
jgi:hypothetical protein